MIMFSLLTNISTPLNFEMHGNKRHLPDNLRINVLFHDHYTIGYIISHEDSMNTSISP